MALGNIYHLYDDPRAGVPYAKEALDDSDNIIRIHARAYLKRLGIERGKTETVGDKSETAIEKPETAEWRLPPDAPQPAIAPFDADEARQHQQSWAQYLGVSVEIANSLDMKLKLVPAGEFMMGSPGSDGRAQACERPQHKVRITKPFYLGVYEVTQGDYKKVMGENAKSAGWFSLEGGGAEEVSGVDVSCHPVENVSWEDAAEFCRRLSAREEIAYRLPTEAEWEYACRAGTTTLYSFGDDAVSLAEYAWHKDNSDSVAHPVGGKRPNAWALHDMHGNVWEWCADWYDPGYYDESPMDDPPGPETGSFRVFRGGSWKHFSWNCRSAGRGRDKPTPRMHLGFRVVAVPHSSAREE
jgi:formylglycine-generating enzyme required for sulfatase activity